MAKLKVFNPDVITIYEVEQLIDEGYRFDIVDGLEEEDYDELGDS